MFDSWCHTLWNHPLAYTTAYIKIPCEVPKIWNSEFNFQSLVVQWWCLTAQESLSVLLWHLSNGFLAATRPVKPAARSLFFTVETDTWLLRPRLSCAWSCCPVGDLSHKAVNSQTFVLLIQLWLWVGMTTFCPFPPVSECFLRVKKAVLTDTLTLFAISLLERPTLWSVFHC